MSDPESLNPPPSRQLSRLSRHTSQSWMVLFAATLLCLNFLILSYPDFFTRFTSDTISAYLLGTAVLVAVNVALLSLPAGEDDKDVSFPHLTGKPWVTALVMLCGLSVLAIGSYHWLQQIFTVPIDPMRADMLVIIREGVTTFLRGSNPYRLYRVPWEMPLSYGPLLWMPYILPYSLRVDPRFLTIAAALFIAALFAVGAAVLAHKQRWVEALALLVVEVTFCLNLALYGFIVIGQTPVYWPLIFVFCYLFSQGRSGPAAVTLGLLVVARTTMTALVPIFFIYAIKDQVEGRRLTVEGGGLKPGVPRLFLYFCLAAILPFLPFAIWNFQSLWYGIYTRYHYIAEHVVWRGADGSIFRTFGTTGFLLSRGWQHYVESVQVGLLLAFYVLGWFRIQSRGQALKWMGMALLIFSMTCLWPVFYIYLDVFVLLGAAFVVEPRILGNWLARVRLVPLLAGTILALAVVLFGTARLLTGNFYEVDVGTATARRYLASGFDKDEYWGKISFAWANTTNATIRLPRLSRSAARLVIVAHPFLSSKDSTQTITAYLNGHPIGTKQLSPGWEAVSFPASSEVWQIGLNQLELRFRYAHSPQSVGLSDDPRPLAVCNPVKHG